MDDLERRFDGFPQVVPDLGEAIILVWSRLGLAGETAVGLAGTLFRSVEPGGPLQRVPSESLGDEVWRLANAAACP